MGKNVVVALFILTCLMSVAVLLTRQPHRTKVSPSVDGAKTPRVSLEDFTVYEYRNHSVISTFSGKLAHFLDPNLLELYGSLRGLRHNSLQREYVSAESATVYFASSGISSLMKNAEVSKAELEDNVKLGVRYQRLLTEYAEYLPSKGVLQSERAVTLKNPDGVVEGKNGFRYFLDKEEVKIFGPIQGELKGAKPPSN